MKVGIIGSGMVGQQMGHGLLKIGHEVLIGTRDTSKLSEWLNDGGYNASIGSFEDAAKFGDVVILATFWAGTKNAIKLAGEENLKNKILIDVTNPLDFSQGTPPKLISYYGNSGGEQIQNLLPESKIVKAFNIVNAYIMINPSREEGEPDLFICGNDEDAKRKVEKLAKSFGWKSIIDLGDISKAFVLEAFAMMWIECAFKFDSWNHAFKLLPK